MKFEIKKPLKSPQTQTGALYKQQEGLKNHTSPYTIHETKIIFKLRSKLP